MRGVTYDELALLEALTMWPHEFGMCDPRCGMQEPFTDDRSVADALVRDRRAAVWPCAYQPAWRHGRVTELGRMAIKLAPLARSV